MTKTYPLAIAALGVALSVHAVQGQGRSGYRTFQLGGNLPSVSALTGVAASAAKTIHLRPAVMQELEWRLPYSVSGSAPAQDPVRQIVFSFYNDQLSRMVVEYDRDRTEGMTDADMIAAISMTYGTRLLPSAVRNTRGAVSRPDSDFGTPIARWEDPDCAVVLYRSSYASGFRMIVTSPRLEALARTADAQAIESDQREAPQREIARQKKDAEDIRVSQEKARLANKATFRP